MEGNEMSPTLLDAGATLAQLHIDGLLRDADHDRLVRMAPEAPEGAAAERGRPESTAASHCQVRLRGNRAA
jgi:hypothetical protein